MDEHALNERWEDVMTDSMATVAEYQEKGWDALGFHAGDVVPIEGAARLDVVLTEATFEDVRERMTDVEIDTFRVFAAHDEGVTFRLVAAEDETEEFALCVPTFLFDRDEEPLNRAAAEAGELVLRLRPPDASNKVDIELADPDTFFESRPSA